MTPLLQQYLDIKKKYQDSILFFRVGDFYEMFFDDAEIASKELELVLTGKDCGMEERAPMAGVPFHAADTYIAKLVSKGFKVAICEQLEDPATAKGIVKRDVVKIVTSGTIIDSSVLDESKNNYLMSIFIDNSAYGLSCVDITTGELQATELMNKKDLINEVSKFNPAEIITNNPNELQIINDIIPDTGIHEFDFLDYKSAKEEILQRFDLNSLEGFGLKELNLATCSIATLLYYVDSTQMVKTNNISSIKVYNVSDYMLIDKTTISNLELLETYRTKEKKGSLLWVLDKTNTPMGSRLIRKWIERPLLSKKEINNRLDAVEELIKDNTTRESIKNILKNIKDFERVMGRVVYKSANARDLIFLKNSIENLPDIKQLMKNLHSENMVKMCNELDTLDDITSTINESINPDAPATLNDGNIIKTGYDKNVDKYRLASTEGKNWLAQLEAEEKEKTGIKNLKIKYNKVFGYYIEVTKSNLNMVPDYYIRKQTLVNCERYVTEKLKDIEDNILGAEEKVKELEYKLFDELRNKIAGQYKRVQISAQIIAQLDVYISLAEVSVLNQYTRPTLTDKKIIDIKAGRHPVIEKIVDDGIFVPNDTNLDTDKNMISLITGPNMAGKSTYMRQVALIVIMAQIGSFVPADSATIGIVDKIFTRIGATDDLSTGQSTFMVEMNEVANIVNNATDKSLILLDEVGRGTSTYDGISIAWAVIEYIAKNIKARTLFATHYHELIDIAKEINSVKNYNIAVKEENDRIVFLRKIEEGPTDRSYGIQVAKLAGLPKDLIDTANQKLIELEDNHEIGINGFSNKVTQISIFDMGYLEILESIKNLDINNMTPIEALNYLTKVKNDLSSLL